MIKVTLADGRSQYLSRNHIIRIVPLQAGDYGFGKGALTRVDLHDYERVFVADTAQCLWEEIEEGGLAEVTDMLSALVRQLKSGITSVAVVPE